MPPQGGQRLFLRRDQMQAVEAYFKNRHYFSRGQESDLQLTAKCLVAHALASGDANSVRDLLRRKNLEKPLRQTLQAMQIIQRNVRGSEGERDGLLRRFQALRVWSGCASLFFTLNPHDIRSPLTVRLLQDTHQWEHRFSLDLTDEEAEEYLTTFLKDNPRRLNEYVAQDPLVGTLVFHDTVRLVLRTLLGCADKAGEGHADGIAAGDTPGLFGYVRSYMGAVEPQMRKALHIHMLVQLLGYMHPDDLFRKGGLQDTFKRLWYYVASVCFRSTEGFADYMSCDAATQTMQALPLLPLAPKQRDMIGATRVRETIMAQTRARSISVASCSRADTRPMVFFPSSLCKTPSVNARKFSAAAVREVQHRTQKSLNHVCKAAVCHKGRVGKMGFCRMGFWHWSRYVNEKKKLVAKRMHGLALQERWNRTGAPPIHTTPPHAGLPAVETTHPFHGKMTPGILMGAQCNHDLGILNRICSVSDDDAEIDDAKLEAIRQNFMEAVGDHEFYCASYSSKEQPHIEGLLVTFADAIKSKDEEIAGLKAEGKDPGPQEEARQRLHRFMSATNRRMHKGFPEMLTYLLEKPVVYCNLDYVSLNLHGKISRLVRLMFNEPAPADAAKVSETRQGYLKTRQSILIKADDYEFRPMCLEQFPLYFFMAATEAQTTRGSSSLPWASLQVDGDGRVAVLDECKTADNISSSHSFSKRPAHNIRRQSTATPVLSKRYAESGKEDNVPLMTASGARIHEYAYYVHLRLVSAWRMPIYHGRPVKAPDSASSACDKGMYALTVMLLFRPYRSLDEIVDWCGLHVDVLGDSDSVWRFVYEGYLRWRRRVESSAARFYDGSVDKQPDPLSQEWWDCMVYERVRNFDGVHARHSADAGKAPANLSALPPFLPTGSARGDDGADLRDGASDGDGVASTSSEDAARVLDGAGVMADDEPRHRRVVSAADPLSRLCGSMPAGSRLEDFHDPPLARAHVRNAEGKYWQNFAEHAREAFSSNVASSDFVNSSSQWEIREVDAVESAKQQELFFKSVDKLHFNASENFATQPSCRRDKFDGELAKIVEDCRVSLDLTPSDTIVMRAAFYLLQRGLLNVPDVGGINVRQARAFLWNAAWLQDYMSDEWRRQGFLADVDCPGRQFKNFALIIVGPGGTGKTAVLKMSEALTTFFVGP